MNMNKSTLLFFETTLMDLIEGFPSSVIDDIILPVFLLEVQLSYDLFFCRLIF